MEKWTVGGKPRMALFAGDKGIMTGDELTYDYNFDPFSQKNVQECRCGSSKCRGVLGPKPKDEKKPKTDKDLVTTTTSKLAGAKRKIAEIFDEGAERWNKKARIAAPGSAMAATKKATASGSSSKKPARARVYSSSHSSATRTALPTALVKKPALRAASLSASGAISRRPSMLRRIVNGAKGKATSRRVFSNASASERLIQGETKQPLTRKDSVAAKAVSIRRNVVRAVRGAKGGSERTLQPMTL
jgi:[histone H3]-lysine4 N-trimethyltransferase ASH1L